MCHLRSSSEFAQVSNGGQKLYAKHFLILVKKSDRSVSRLGMTVTRKVAPLAVVRNRLRRRVREVFRLNRHRLQAAFDIVIIARNNAGDCDYAAVEREILSALSYGRCINRVA